MDDELLRALARAQKRHAEPDVPMDTTANRVDQTGPTMAALVAPFAPEERAAMLDAVFSRIDAEQSDGPVPIASAAKASRGRVVAIVGAVIAMAAALVLWVALPRSPEPQLPGYALTELRGGASAVRSDPSALDRVVELRAGDEIAVTITPESATHVPLVVDVIAEGRGRAAVMARVPAEVSRSGAVRITGSLGGWLDLEPGAWRITVTLSPSDLAPDTAMEALADERLRRVAFDVQVTADR